MRHILFFIICAVMYDMVSAQTDSTRVVIDYRYVGILASGNFYTDSFRIEPGASVRVGGGLSYYPHKTIRIQSWGFADYNGKTLTKNIMFGVHYLPSKNVNLSLGNIPTLTAGMRPTPPTAWGHFEPWTSAQLPGTAPGFTMKYSFSGSDIGLGAYYRLRNLEFHGRMKIGSMLAVGYYNVSNTWGASVGILRDKFTLKAMVTDSLAGVLTIVSLYHKEEISMYLDAGMNRDQVVRAEIGVFKSFEKKPFGGLIGIGYSYEIRAVKCYLFLYLQ